ncbi:MAG: DNA polymerase III subunit gamma/tau [Phycisphaerales bacterium]|nr:DNA polymerase III subunit gamma/tau [Phycisphaerales bacterium]
MAEAYTVLARRYRSRDFSELIGQEPIAQTLKNAVATGRLAHAFLFTGTRGVGKTSSARILAKAINCPNVKDGQPCGTCNTCQAIARGEEIDVIEIDGASNNGVDQIRELRQNAGVAPSHCPFKIYIIDEVHMLTTAAFNALLKTLEEPPPHVKFIFATTDVQKLPATILSRCQRYDFKNIPTGTIAEYLALICQQEKVVADPAALHRIAATAAGSMRDALSLLDRVLSLGAQRVTEQLLQDLLGKPPLEAVAGVIQAIAAQDAALTLQHADEQLNSGLSMERLLADLSEFFRNILIAKACGHDSQLLDMPAEWRQSVATLAPKFDTPTLVHHIALADQTLRSIKFSTMPRPLFDALMVRLALAQQFSSLGELLDQVGRAADTEPSPQKKNDPLTTASATAATTHAPLPTGAAPIASQPIRQAPAQPNSPSQRLANAPARPPQAVSNIPAVSGGDLWQALQQRLAESLQFVAIGNYCQLDRCDFDAGIMRLSLPLRLQASAEPLRPKIEGVLAELANRQFRVEFQYTDDAALPAPRPGTAPAPHTARSIDPELLQRLRDNPAVKSILDKFGGMITAVEPLQDADAAAHQP